MNKERLYSLDLALVGAGALALAFTSQFGFDLEPCVLCLYQRVPFALVIALGLAGLWRPEHARAALGLAALVFLGGAALAFYHVGVEQHWWASATGCTGDAERTYSPAELMQSLQAPIAKPCDAVDWTFLGVSMAGWNVVFSSLCAVAAGLARARLKES